MVGKEVSLLDLCLQGERVLEIVFLFVLIFTMAIISWQLKGEEVFVSWFEIFIYLLQIEYYLDPRKAPCRSNQAAALPEHQPPLHQESNALHQVNCLNKIKSQSIKATKQMLVSDPGNEQKWVGWNTKNEHKYKSKHKSPTIKKFFLLRPRPVREGGDSHLPVQVTLDFRCCS